MCSISYRFKKWSITQYDGLDIVMAYIVCKRCEKSFSDRDWTDGEVKLYAAQRVWICANCEIEIVSGWIDEH